MSSENLFDLTDSDTDDEEIESNDSLDSIYTKMPDPDADEDPISFEGLRRETSEILRPKLKELREKEKRRLKQAKLESLAWDQDYQLTPKGEISVAELLQVIFMFLQASQSTLLSVSSVSRAWRERATYLPQWSYLRLRFPKHAPPSSIRNGPRQVIFPPSDELNSIPSVTTVAVSREIYFSYLWRNQEHNEQMRAASRMRKVKRVKDHGCAFALGVGGLGAFAALCFLSAWGVGSSTAVAFNNDGKVGAASFLFGFLMLLVALIVGLYVIDTRTCISDTNIRNRVLLPGGVALLTTCLILLIPTTVFGLLTARYRVMKEIAATPMYNASCAAVNASVGYIGQPIPYFVVFPPQSASNWVLGSTSYSGLETGQNYSLLVAKQPCQPGLGLWQQREIAVVNGPGFNASTWWAQFVEINTIGRGGASSTGEGETLIFRTTLINQYYPLPWYLNPDAPWKTPNPTFAGGSRPTPVIGTYAMTFPEEAPMTQANKFLEAMYITIYVSCGIFALAATTFLCQKKRAECCMVFWGVIAVLCFNAFTMIGWGAACRWGDHDYCLISKSAAQGLFIAGWIGIGVGVAMAIYENCCD